MRQRRSDRNHIIYRITSPDGDYIGLTVMRGRAIKKSLQIRLDGHFYRANVEMANLPISRAIRRSPDNISISLIEIVRGKTKAHERELSLIREMKPRLNTQGNSFTEFKESIFSEEEQLMMYYHELF